jgi:hypothetical protein
MGSGIATAQTAPGQLPMQGFLTDAAGAPVDQELTMVFSLYTTDTGGAALYTETQTVRVESGFFSAEVGSVTPLDLALFRDNGTVFVGIQAGADPEMSPRIQLGSVPYAAFAQFAAAVAGPTGGSAGQIDFRGNTMNTTPTELDSVTVNAPGPGTLVVTAFMDIFVDCDSTAAGSAICSNAAVGLCDTANSSGDCGGSYSRIWHEDPSGPALSTNQQHFVTIGRTVSVPAAGPVRIFVNGQSHPTGGSVSTAEGFHIQSGVLIAEFHPGPALLVTNP